MGGRMMTSDYLLIKIALLIIVLLVLSGGFYASLNIIINAFKKEDKESQIEPDDLDFHYEQIEIQKNSEKELIKKIEKIRTSIDSLTKAYEDGVFLKKNLRIWQITKSLYLDLSRWKKKKSFQLNEEQVEYYLEDIILIFKELGVELIKPQIGDMFDSATMKVVETVPGLHSQNNSIAEVEKNGFKLHLKDRDRILQVAEVKVYKN
jgi:molecular chaperone GrpE (heat shock protein)